MVIIVIVPVPIDPDDEDSGEWSYEVRSMRYRPDAPLVCGAAPDRVILDIFEEPNPRSEIPTWFPVRGSMEVKRPVSGS